MENLDLKFRPIAEFVLDFIHQSTAYALRYEGREGNFTKYSYDNGFFMTRLLLYSTKHKNRLLQVR